MSMEPEQENFQQLRRLLALKRHERPPPGYFDGFSRNVVARIRTEQKIGRKGWFFRIGTEAPWLVRIWDSVQTKPLMVGAFGACVSALLVVGLVLSEKVEPTPVAAANVEASPLLQAEAQPAAASQYIQKASIGAFSSTEGVSTVELRPGRDSLFQGAQEPALPLFQKLDYKPAGN